MHKILNGKKVNLSKDEIETFKNEFKKGKEEQEKMMVVSKRLAAYGTAEEQLEFIVENGIDAFISRQLSIKKTYPKIT